MKTRASNWIPLALLLLLAAATVWLAHTVTGVPIRSDGATRHAPDMIVENFSAKQFGENGDVRDTLAAPRMVHYPDDDTSHLTNIKFEAFERNNPSLRATADTALLT